ncbi:hypothetical protein DF186_22530, partial [Enterococcus hirae]
HDDALDVALRAVQGVADLDLARADGREGLVARHEVVPGADAPDLAPLQGSGTECLGDGRHRQALSESSSGGTVAPSSSST